MFYDAPFTDDCDKAPCVLLEMVAERISNNKQQKQKHLTHTHTYPRMQTNERRIKHTHRYVVLMPITVFVFMVVVALSQRV